MLLEPVAALIEWTEEHRAGVETAREEFDCQQHVSTQGGELQHESAKREGR